ncbi:HK97 family phage prohead protease [Roseibium denhamense]|uniref:Prohead serine protease domain-containing protein n=1 Tax=Roseibium denhamense TaxID=76305 RepID=A0ABY1PMZ3_9HYPH|nr:HK97 family phage prohead protease [Roseibium denhamense]MTI05706.1 HK97 family phage prohead protease [Roseibium denhamense]SMP36922.1 prohead peptidase. Unknown type peptidase. MEROPS family U35 [Roseibium denhamense]
MTAPAERPVRFAGYASLFETLDGAGDRIMAGAFRKSLRQRGVSRTAMLWQHDPERPIGRWTRLIETEDGLWAEGELTTGVGLAAEAARLLAGGAMNGLSIGFKARMAQRSANRRERLLSEIDLWEISLVTFPQMEEARVRFLSN